LEEDASSQEVRTGLETGSAAADLDYLGGLGLAGRHDMVRHCSELEVVHPVDRQLETEDEVPEKMELEMHVLLGMVQESYDRLVSRGEEPGHREQGSCGHYLASSMEEGHASEGCHLGPEGLDRDELVVDLVEVRRLENHLDLGEA
jgi:hypothetical protein